MSATLVQFAGDDKRARQKPSALSLFDLGCDTVEIAKRLGVEEHVASRRLNAERCKAKGLPLETAPSPYRKSRVKDWLAGEHPGIGRSGL
ncbi:hypothetical protein [Aquamicrobium soli]|uniref:Helix-turn-helix domain-containing protein n=1 Tax=Aquamicrobium soli TaxID=1811518 RepID=A0ABV7KJZ6_9HYPH